MKSILVIGIGRFGQHLCEFLAQQENEIMAVDMKEERLEPILPMVVSAKIGDCTNETVLKSLGVDNFDVCFVCIGNNFQNSLEVTSLIKEMGAKHVVSKANRKLHARLLLKNGADDVVYPDRDVAEKIAIRYSANHVFDYTELAGGVSIYEILPLKGWIGKSIKELNIRQVYGISIIGSKDAQGTVTVLPEADHVIQADHHLMVLGRRKETEKILRELK